MGRLAEHHLVLLLLFVWVMYVYRDLMPLGNVHIGPSEYLVGIRLYEGCSSDCCYFRGSPLHALTIHFFRPEG